MGRTPEQRTDAVSGLGPWLQQDTRDRNMGGVPGTSRQSHQEHPVPRWWPWGGHGRGVWSPNPPGIWGSAWLPLKEAHAETSQQEWLGGPKSRGGGGAVGSEGR